MASGIDLTLITHFITIVVKAYELLLLFFIIIIIIIKIVIIIIILKNNREQAAIQVANIDNAVS